jgi:plastocyanin
MTRTSVRGMALGASAAAAIALLSGCGVTDQGENTVNGKQLFVQRCGACHVLQRAGTKGVTGPNLDEAFQQARKDGFKDSTFEGMVHRQIRQPNKNPQVDPKTGKVLPLMPPNIVKGDDAEDVAAYVAGAVAKPGEDGGQLASVGGAKAEGTAEAENGKVEIPANPDGQLLYEFADAKAPAGQLEIDSPNESTVPHDISLEGNGVNERGEVVSNGGVSRVSVDLKAGEYTFYCSVTGHREAGMEGKLTVGG